jgi:hypothetical protein
LTAISTDRADLERGAMKVRTLIETGLRYPPIDMVQAPADGPGHQLTDDGLLVSEFRIRSTNSLVAINDNVSADRLRRLNDNYRTNLTLLCQHSNQPAFFFQVVYPQRLVFSVQQVQVDLHTVFLAQIMSLWRPVPSHHIVSPRAKAYFSGF